MLSRIKKMLIPLASYLQNCFSDKWKAFDQFMEQADGIIIGGGNMLMDSGLFPCYTLFFYKYIRIARAHNKKVFVLDIGAGPFRTHHQHSLARKAIRMADYSSVRDPDSAALLGTPQLARDPAFFIPCAERHSVRDTVCISVIADGVHFSGDFDAYINSLVRIAERLNGYGKIVLYSTEASDYPAVYEVYKRLDKSTAAIAEIKNLQDILELYSHARIVIGSRMHSLILAMTQQLPTLALSWDNKIASLYRLAGMEERVFDVRAARKETNRISTLAEKLLAGGHCTKTEEFVNANRAVLEAEYTHLARTIKGE